jgi:hypothetical protein
MSAGLPAKYPKWVDYIIRLQIPALSGKVRESLFLNEDRGSIFNRKAMVDCIVHAPSTL